MVGVKKEVIGLLEDGWVAGKERERDGGGKERERKAENKTITGRSIVNPNRVHAELINILVTNCLSGQY